MKSLMGRREDATMKEKILVVDDDETLANLLVNLLNVNGYQASKSFKGREALRMISEDQPDLVLLDILMPELNGFDVLTKLRQDPKTKDIPVVIVTALSDELYVLEGWVRDTDGYLSKPFRPDDLLETIKVVLSRTIAERHHERAKRIDCLLEMLCECEDSELESII
jgi:DNA-binding response OmpR family regulator